MKAYSKTTGDQLEKVTATLSQYGFILSEKGGLAWSRGFTSVTFEKQESDSDLEIYDVTVQTSDRDDTDVGALLKLIGLPKSDEKGSVSEKATKGVSLQSDTEKAVSKSKGKFPKKATDI